MSNLNDILSGRIGGDEYDCGEKHYYNESINSLQKTETPTKFAYDAFRIVCVMHDIPPDKNQDYWAPTKEHLLDGSLYDKIDAVCDGWRSCYSPKNKVIMDQLRYFSIE